MDVIIQEVVSTVRVVDGQSLLSDRTLAQIVRAVLEAIEAKEAKDQQRRADTRTHQAPTGPRR